MASNPQNTPESLRPWVANLESLGTLLETAVRIGPRSQMFDRRGDGAQNPRSCPLENLLAEPGIRTMGVHGNHLAGDAQ